MESPVILKSKIVPPRLKNTSIRRARLFRKLTETTDYPLTLVVSGAGYGKSTTLALYIEDSREKICWYSLSNQDNDLIPFITYLIESIRIHYPSFGTELLNKLHDKELYSNGRDTANLSSLFINEVASIQSIVKLVLDDFHVVQETEKISAFIEYILKNCPKNLHLIIASRTRPKWQILTKLMLEGNLLEVKQEELLLTLEEVELLLNECYRVEVNNEDLQDIYALTEGWVIALGMVGVRLQEFKPLPVIKQEKHSLSDLFQYIVFEVLDKQPAHIKTFIEQTSILEDLSAPVCNQLLGIRNSSAILEALFEKHIFIVSANPSQYRYHGLVREQMENHLKSSDYDLYISLHLDASAYYKKEKQYDSMFYHLKQASDYGQMTEQLSEHGFSLLREGKVKMILDLLQCIPDHKKDENGWLWYFSGEVYRLLTEVEKAEKSYGKALKASQDPKLMSHSYEGMARIYIDTIQPGKAERHLSLAIESRDLLKGKDEEEIVELYCLMAENLINIGKPERARKWLQQAVEKGLTLDEYNMKARLYLRTGKLQEAIDLLMKQIGKAESKQTAIHLSHRETDLLLSFIYVLSGDGEQAKQAAQRAIQQGLELKSSYVEACGWMRMAHAVQLLGFYKPELILECYETALFLMDQLQISRGKAEPLMGLCLYWGSQPDGLQKAMAYGQLALNETEKVQDIWLSSLIKLAMAKACISHDAWKKGKVLIDEAFQFSRDCNDRYGEMVALYWKTYISYKNETESFQEDCRLFLLHIENNEIHFFLFKKTLFGPEDTQQFIPLLLRARKKGINTALVNRLLAELGYAELELHPGYALRIETLGTFRVWRGQEEITEWQRTKAKELFQLFITYSDRSFSKKEIVSTLWPDEDEKTSIRNLKVVLNALNNLLEPGRKSRSEPFFIRREGELYSLNRQAEIRIDINEFEQWAIAGLEANKMEKARDYLERSLPLYKGDFLQERRFEDWCIRKRDHARSLYLRGAEKMSQLLIAQNEITKATQWCHAIIACEETWEEAYRMLMYCYYRMNNRPQAIKLYRQCCEILERELGIEPLPTTRKMHQMIVDASLYDEDLLAIPVK